MNDKYNISISDFQRNGYLIARNIIPTELIDRYVEGLKDLIRIRMESVGVTPTNGGLDCLFNKLCLIDRKLGGDIYDHAKDIPEFQEILALPAIREIAINLLQTSRPLLAASQSVFRIDRPNEDDLGFRWHQDYWYNCLSRSALTFWIPLTEITEDMGRVDILPTSHKRLHAVHLCDPSNSKGNMAKIFEFREKIDQSNIIQTDVGPNDALIFHAQLMHRSGLNRSNKARWTVQVRWSDFYDKDLASRGWNHGTFRGRVTFVDVHPDLVLVENQKS